MRIVNIIEEGKIGGPQTRIVTVAAAIKHSINTVVVMPIENSKRFQQKCQESNIPYHAMNITRITKEWKIALRYILFSFIEIIRLTIFIKKENFDLVHVSGGSWQYKGVIAGKLAGKKVVWHLNDTLTPRFIRSIFFIINNLADGFIFASERSKEYYKPLIKSEKYECVIPSPVDTDFFSPFENYCGDEELISNWLNKTVLGTIANINSIKGLEVFIRSAAEINKSADNVVFVIIGLVYKNQQKYYEKLKQLCFELKVSNVEFIGGRKDVRPLLKRFDIYICTSHAESSPVSVWEALSMGKPIVSTDVGDVHLYVTNNGYIAPVRDIQEISTRLMSLIGNQRKIKIFGELSRKVAVSKLNKEICAKKHIRAYTEINIAS